MSTTETIARAFALGLLSGCSFAEDGVVYPLDGLGIETMRRIVSENYHMSGLTYMDTCETHAHCDANMYMLSAMQASGYLLEGPEPENDEVTGLWNDAWSMAKENGFYLEA